MVVTAWGGGIWWGEARMPLNTHRAQDGPPNKELPGPERPRCCGREPDQMLRRGVYLLVGAERGVNVCTSALKPPP